MHKGNLFVWSLYDFANSIVSIAFFLYFSQWLVVDRGVADFWYNASFAAGSLLLLLTAPVLGALADKTGRQKIYLNWITTFSAIFLFATSVVTLFFSNNPFLALTLFLLGNYLYQFSFVFYNALLPFIAPFEKWGKASGIGISANFAGQVVGMTLILPFVGGSIYFFGETGRAQALMPATLTFFLLALPMLLYFKGPKPIQYEGQISLREEYSNQWKNFKELIRDNNIKFFLLAYFFFNDAVITVVNNFPLYLENVFEVSDNLKTILLSGALLTSIFGALISGFVADKIGLKKSLVGVIGIWIIFLPILGLNRNFQTFMILCVLMGFLYGGIWTISRTAMAAITPNNKMNFGFSFYTLAERTSTLVGPIAWGGIVSGLGYMGADSYRIAMVSMAVFVTIGLYLVRKVNLEEPNSPAE